MSRFPVTYVILPLPQLNILSSGSSQLVGTLMRQLICWSGSKTLAVTQLVLLPLRGIILSLRNLGGTNKLSDSNLGPLVILWVAD